jgi:Holliday junction resolvase
MSGKRKKPFVYWVVFCKIVSSKILKSARESKTYIVSLLIEGYLSNCSVFGPVPYIVFKVDGTSWRFWRKCD